LRERRPAVRRLLLSLTLSSALAEERGKSLADEREKTAHWQRSNAGILVHVAAEQQAPIAHEPVEQFVVQLLPLQWTLPAHEPVPLQVITFVAPSAATPIAHDCGPEQVA